MSAAPAESSKAAATAAAAPTPAAQQHTCAVLAKINQTVIRDLARFVTAQDGKGHHFPLSAAMAELKSTGKKSCWIWYCFPQILDSGRSSANNTTYQLRSQVEIVAFLLHPVLGPRQMNSFHICRTQLEKGMPLQQLMGSGIDAKKLWHSATSFCFAVDSLLEEDQKRDGEISKAVGEERWGQIRTLHSDLNAVLDQIQKQSKTANLPRHDPQLKEKWDKMESWPRN